MKQTDDNEEYYIQMDQFIIHIQDVVNPARKKAGLTEIGIDEARACFRIFKEFERAWNNFDKPPKNG